MDMKNIVATFIFFNQNLKFITLFFTLKQKNDTVVQLSIYKYKTASEKHKKSEFDLEENLYGKPSEGYYTTIFLGTPPQEIKVLIDTGSSNFAVADSSFDTINHYFYLNKSLTYRDLKIKVDVPYTQGHWEGDLGSDILSIKNVVDEKVVNPEFKEIQTRVKVALIKNSSNFFIDGSQWSGILGLGYSRLSRPSTNVLPVFDQLVYDKKVKNIFSIQLCTFSNDFQYDNRNSPTGTLIFGGIHQSLFIGNIFYTPIIRKWYYEVVVTDIAVDGTTLGFECQIYNKDRTIVDTGTTNFRVNGIIFETLIDRIKQHEKIGIPDEFWQGYNLMCWNIYSMPFSSFPEISISLSSATSEKSQFSLLITPELYLREAVPEQNVSDQKCYRFAISKSEKGIIIGAVFMEGFYVIFDRESSKIGFAKSSCHEKGKMNSRSRISNKSDLNFSVRECYNTDSVEDSDSVLRLIMLVFAGISIITIIPSALILIKIAFMTRNNNEL